LFKTFWLLTIWSDFNAYNKTLKGLSKKEYSALGKKWEKNKLVNVENRKVGGPILPQ
jgi:hypothetical protein